MVPKWVQRSVIWIIAIALALLVYYNVIVTKDFSIAAPAVYPRDKKRIAVCISGQIRPTWKSTLPTIKKYIIDAYHADVFASFDEDVSAPDQREILALLHPKRYAFEAFTPLSANVYSKNYGLMMQRMISCNNMKKDIESQQGFTYDVVIRVRPDMFMKDSPPMELIDNVAENTVYSYDFGHFMDVVAFYGISDQYFFGSSSTLDKVLTPSVITMIDRLPVCKFSEYILRSHMHEIGITIKMFYSSSLIYAMLDKGIIERGSEFVKGIGYTVTPPSIVCDALNAMAQ
jgi:hypothetical protein